MARHPCDTTRLMRPRLNKRFIPGPGLALAFQCAWLLTTAACPIPVFQYSLEYWDSDPYDVVVHHNGDLTGEQREMLDMLMEMEQEGGAANISVIIRDHSLANQPARQDAELPRIELRYPRISGIREPVWEGPMTRELIDQMLDSPMRQRIATKLLGRKTAVWVLLESGDRAADRAARRTLENELERLENTLKVAEPEEEIGFDFGNIDTDIDFEILRLSRDDPEEQMFIRMLLGTERDLKDTEDQPIAFPIYGRGLVMYALVGQGINTWTLTRAGEFLTGPCSCQIKAGNPGVDLLMSVKWKDKVEQRSIHTTPGAAAAGFEGRIEEAEQRLND